MRQLSSHSSGGGAVGGSGEGGGGGGEGAGEGGEVGGGEGGERNSEVRIRMREQVVVPYLRMQRASRVRSLDRHMLLRPPQQIDSCYSPSAPPPRCVIRQLAVP